MSEKDDLWSDWFRQRSWWPFTRRWISDDVKGVFEEMEDIMVSRFKELSENAPENLLRERTLPDGGKVKEWGPFVYGYSMVVDEDGRPQIREFGNLRPKAGFQRDKLDVQEKREPLADVMVSDGKVQIIIELPGVSKEDIDLRLTPNSLTIAVDTQRRKYFRKLEMPVKVDPKTAKTNYINGVLEMSVKETKEKEIEGEKLEIE
ncbi:MAG: Hsp20/alpha crystallin family protein [Candidatus Bathyarchaeum tardum]|nr:MAG: Hsp20/alpha crystallin family protein [Candidatus Bathyarchaeum tardum]